MPRFCIINGDDFGSKDVQSEIGRQVGPHQHDNAVNHRPQRGDLQDPTPLSKSDLVQT